MIPPRLAIGLEARDGMGWRPSLNGNGVGPWMDEPSARFVVEWLAVSKSNITATLSLLRVGTTFAEAIGLVRPGEGREPEGSGGKGPRAGDAGGAIEPQPVKGVA